ncbi:MAG: hypothetical protein H0T73_06110 [Ardenticatenales bacterium]|nr:hypothetical protein [Ardenticatenales bacterium]
MEQLPAPPPTSTLHQILAILLPFFIVGSFFSFNLEEQPYHTPAPLLLPESVAPNAASSLAPTTAEEHVYVEQVRLMVGEYIDTLARIGPHYNQYQEDSTLLGDATWRSEVLPLFATLTRISEEAKVTIAPGRYGSFQERFTRVAQRYLLAGQLYEEGLGAQDEETILLAEEAYGRANAGLAELMNNDLSLIHP